MTKHDVQVAAQRAADAVPGGWLAAVPIYQPYLVEQEMWVVGLHRGHDTHLQVALTADLITDPECMLAAFRHALKVT
jgi:hypothetical protein